jgi:hypothetical protein
VGALGGVWIQGLKSRFRLVDRLLRTPYAMAV